MIPCSHEKDALENPAVDGENPQATPSALTSTAAFDAFESALTRLHEWLAQRNRKRITCAELLGALESLCPEISFSERRMRALHILQTLHLRGLVRYAQKKGEWDCAGNPALPRLVTFVRASAPAQPATPTAWIPQLRFASTLSRGSQLEKLRKLNEFVIANRARLSFKVPYRERALEIFGDEKAFKGILRSGKLWGRVELSLIGAWEPEHPLAREDFADVAGPLLIVENLHTWHSLLNWNIYARRYRSIAYGVGLAVTQATQAICTALERSGANGLHYFGDLDAEGLDIAIRVRRNLQGQGAIPLEPAHELYVQLLTLGVRRPATGQDVSLGAAEWLGALAQPVDELFASGHWLPQEGLSLEKLWNGLPATSRLSDR